ncbi:hypothetical protein BGZ57DRAFT_896852 [Hyaloscypha finlandica]|nr:hypothetical protein BGZ57DRAFT_896852 [Hyaloscypha finlandica]
MPNPLDFLEGISSLALAPFQIQSVDGNLDPTKASDSPSVAPPLGVLENFKGTFAGTGFSLIFRPNSGPPTTTTFPNPVFPPPPMTPSENVLMLNLTTETLSFSPPLGSVPNRGLSRQNDIFLNGVSYVQTVNDVTNVATGKADGTPVPIHFEPGLWMHIPPSTSDPTITESIVRMGSIPHGTTINAQCLAPSTTLQGPPIIPPVNITPFLMGTSQLLGSVPFISQTAAKTNTPRLPQDLSKFIAEGTITQATLNDPNTVLRDANLGKSITKTVSFTVSTHSATPDQGGGTTNIAFLRGVAARLTGALTGGLTGGLFGGITGGLAPGFAGAATGTGPNAEAVQMSATFWIETVQHSIVVPPFKPGQVSDLH